MNENMIIRLLKREEFDMWDSFVDQSEQGNIFSKSFWLTTICGDVDSKSRIYGVFNKNNELIAGLPICHRRKWTFKIAAYPPITPFLGLLYSKKNTHKFSKTEPYEQDIVSALTEKLRSEYSHISLSLDPSISDIRPFKFEGWDSNVAYTYYVDLSNMMSLWEGLDKDCKYDIKKSEENNLIFSKEDDIKFFYSLYSKTYSRQNMAAPVYEKVIIDIYKKLSEKGSAQIYSAKKDGQIIASSLVIFDRKRAYYLLAASDPDNRQFKAPSFLLWNILKDVSNKHHEIDLVGANTPSIIRFKRGFATKLIPYYTLSIFSNKFLKSLFYLRSFFR